MQSTYDSLFSGGLKGKSTVKSTALSKFGWYGSILSVAKSYGMKPKEVERLKMHDFLKYLSHDNAVIDYQNRMNAQ